MDGWASGCVDEKGGGGEGGGAGKGVSVDVGVGVERTVFAYYTTVAVWIVLEEGAKLIYQRQYIYVPL